MPAVAGAYRAVLLAHHGRTEDARKALRGLEETRASGYLPPALLARVYASLGEVDSALEALEAREAGALLQPPVSRRIDRDYESLRPDPRFGELVQRLGLVVQ